MALAAGLQIIRGSLRESFMGCFLIDPGIVPAVAAGTALHEMGIFSDQLLVNQKAAIVRFRRNRRRSTRSPLPFPFRHGRNFAKQFEKGFARVAGNAAAFVLGSNGCRKDKQKDGNNQDQG